MSLGLFFFFFLIEQELNACCHGRRRALWRSHCDTDFTPRKNSGGLKVKGLTTFTAFRPSEHCVEAPWLWTSSLSWNDRFLATFFPFSCCFWMCTGFGVGCHFIASKINILACLGKNKKEKKRKQARRGKKPLCSVRLFWVQPFSAGLCR